MMNYVVESKHLPGSAAQVADTNNDNIIDAEELSRLAQVDGLSAVEQLLEFDQNDDGIIDEEELKALHTVRDGKERLDILSVVQDRLNDLIQRKGHYLNLLTYLGFMFTYFVVLFLQREAVVGYNIRYTLKEALLPSDAVKDYPTVSEMYDWLTGLVTNTWKDPVCGDRLCEPPYEYPGFGPTPESYGCSADCGVNNNATNVSFIIAMSSWEGSPAQIGAASLAETQWNLCTSFEGLRTGDYSTAQIKLSSFELGEDGLMQPVGGQDIFCWWPTWQQFTSVDEVHKEKLWLVNAEWEFMLYAPRGGVSFEMRNDEGTLLAAQAMCKFQCDEANPCILPRMYCNFELDNERSGVCTQCPDPAAEECPSFGTEGYGAKQCEAICMQGATLEDEDYPPQITQKWQEYSYENVCGPGETYIDETLSSESQPLTGIKSVDHCKAACEALDRCQTVNVVQFSGSFLECHLASWECSKDWLHTVARDTTGANRGEAVHLAVLRKVNERPEVVQHFYQSTRTDCPMENRRIMLGSSSGYTRSDLAVELKYQDSGRERQTTAGAPCHLPFDAGGVTYTDCIWQAGRAGSAQNTSQSPNGWRCPIEHVPSSAFETGDGQYFYSTSTLGVCEEFTVTRCTSSDESLSKWCNGAIWLPTMTECKELCSVDDLCIGCLYSCIKLGYTKVPVCHMIDSSCGSVMFYKEYLSDGKGPPLPACPRLPPPGLPPCPPSRLTPISPHLGFPSQACPVPPPGLPPIFLPACPHLPLPACPVSSRLAPVSPLQALTAFFEQFPAASICRAVGWFLQTFAVRGRGERPAVCHDASDFSVSLPQLGVDTAYGCSDVVGALRDLGLSGNCSRAYADMSVTYGSAPDELRDLASSCSHSCDTCFPASTASFLLNEQQSSYQQATATCDHRGGQLAWFDTRVDVTGLAELMGSKGFTSVWVGAKAVNSSFVYAHSGAAFPFDVEVPAGLASPACVTLESMLGVEKFVAASCAMAGPSACRLSACSRGMVSADLDQPSFESCDMQDHGLHFEASDADAGNTLEICLPSANSSFSLAAWNRNMTSEATLSASIFVAATGNQWSSELRLFPAGCTDQMAQFVSLINVSQETMRPRTILDIGNEQRRYLMNQGFDGYMSEHIRTATNGSSDCAGGETMIRVLISSSSSSSSTSEHSDLDERPSAVVVWGVRDEMGQYGDLITTHMSVVSDSSNAFCLDITTSHKYEIRVIESDIVANFAVADAAGCELNHTSTSLPPLQYNTSTITHASLDFLMNGICSNWIDLVSGVGADECTSLARANPHCGAHIVCTTYQEGSPLCSERCACSMAQGADCSLGSCVGSGLSGDDCATPLYTPDGLLPDGARGSIYSISHVASTATGVLPGAQQQAAQPACSPVQKLIDWPSVTRGWDGCPESSRYRSRYTGGQYAAETGFELLRVEAVESAPGSGEMDTVQLPTVLAVANFTDYASQVDEWCIQPGSYIMRMLDDNTGNRRAGNWRDMNASSKGWDVGSLTLDHESGDELLMFAFMRDESPNDNVDTHAIEVKLRSNRTAATLLERDDFCPYNRATVHDMLTVPETELIHSMGVGGSIARDRICASFLCINPAVYKYGTDLESTVDCCTGTSSAEMSVGLNYTGEEDHLRDDGSKSRSRFVGTKGSNRLIAGMLISQDRNPSRKCTTKFQNLSGSCTERGKKSKTPYGVDSVFLPTSTHLYNPSMLPFKCCDRSSYTSECMPPTCGHFYAADELNAESDKYVPDLESVDHSEDSDQSDGTVPFGFFPNDGKFDIWFDVNMDQQRARDMITYMQDGLFYDELTNHIRVRMVMYNSRDNFFGNVDVSFRVLNAGLIRSTYSVNCIKVELYETSDDLVRLALEILFAGMVLFAVFNEMRELLEIFRSTGSVRSYFVSFWNYVDIISLSASSSLIVTWIYFASRASEFHIEPWYDVYASLEGKGRWLMLANNGAGLREVMEKLNNVTVLNDIQVMYWAIGGLNGFLLVIRVLKMCHFQPRLGIVTRTLQRAVSDLGHFFMLFLAVFTGYSVTGHLVFGTQPEAKSRGWGEGGGWAIREGCLTQPTPPRGSLMQFSTLWDAMSTLFNVVVFGEVEQLTVDYNSLCHSTTMCAIMEATTVPQDLVHFSKTFFRKVALGEISDEKLAQVLGDMQSAEFQHVEAVAREFASPGAAKKTGPLRETICVLQDIKADQQKRTRESIDLAAPPPHPSWYDKLFTTGKQTPSVQGDKMAQVMTEAEGKMAKYCPVRHQNSMSLRSILSSASRLTLGSEMSRVVVLEDEKEEQIERYDPQMIARRVMEKFGIDESDPSSDVEGAERRWQREQMMSMSQNIKAVMLQVAELKQEMRPPEAKSPHERRSASNTPRMPQSPPSRVAPSPFLAERKEFDFEVLMRIDRNLHNMCRHFDPHIVQGDGLDGRDGLDDIDNLDN
ncbi:hypothetical protein CYMTET_4498 [Cymbomonas tetramitiformis]|uniref:EF-hand domain-containing protein n=1 Tax=Cymbomonas tetramitiformis TaxID=36881 RepID=A0AAE0LK22_9CHLO|nr:hypothetical protein CYMTET_4498 [Cymbomonas tetramitiformis]